MTVEVRIRYGRARRRFRVASPERAAALRAMARQMAGAQIDAARAFDILEDAAQAATAEFIKLQRLVERLTTSDTLEAKPKRSAEPTFAEVAQQWTSGELHREFPDQIELIDQTSNLFRLNKYVLPVIGHLPIRQLTRDDADVVMRRLPEDLSRSSRRHVAQVIHRVLNLAELIGVIDRNPLPRGWLPKPSARKLFPILYPAEDAALLACTEIPLAYRVLYGVAHREGFRRGELAELRWRQFDLDNETVTLDENKTDHARYWRLAPGVAAALRAWRALCGAAKGRAPSGDEHVFIDHDGRPFAGTRLQHLATRVRDDLFRAGARRSALHNAGTNVGRFGMHCLRRSFVTRALAVGRTEDWVRQRTGHTSEELLRYRQAARALADLDLGEVERLDVAIPELTSRPLLPPAPSGVPWALPPASAVGSERVGHSGPPDGPENGPATPEASPEKLEFSDKNHVLAKVAELADALDSGSGRRDAFFVKTHAYADLAGNLDAPTGGKGGYPEVLAHFLAHLGGRPGDQKSVDAVLGEALLRAMRDGRYELVLALADVLRARGGGDVSGAEGGASELDGVEGSEGDGAEGDGLRPALATVIDLEAMRRRRGRT